MAAGRDWETMRPEESPGSTETRCRITSGGGNLERIICFQANPRESATESKPPGKVPHCGTSRVRVKGCGKSAPLPRRRGGHGKPHREQDRIGAVVSDSAVRWDQKQAGFRAAARVGCMRRLVTSAPDEWPSIVPRGEIRKGRGQNPAYRPPDQLSSRFCGIERFCCLTNAL